jgi:hypothetical protein
MRTVTIVRCVLSKDGWSVIMCTDPSGTNGYCKTQAVPLLNEPLYLNGTLSQSYESLDRLPVAN